METQQLGTNLSYSDYLTMEAQNETRFEYESGRVFAMAGGTLNHNIITGNFLTGLKPQLKQKGCRVFTENVRVEAARDLSYRYPDVVVACHPFDLRGNNQIICQPRLIVEVLSKSTEKADRGVKWQRYRKIPSLIYYVLVDQYKVTVELFSRIEETNEWISSIYESLDDVIVLPRLDAELPLSAIYDDIELLGEEADEEEVS
jgi:Uma2 family endonuclease